MARTRRAIREALLNLMAQRGGADITPKDVADAALINKKTFMAHYASVGAVIQEMEDEAVSSVSEVLDEAAAATDEEGLARAIERLGSMVTDGASSLGRLLRTGAREDVVARIQLAVRDRLRRVVGAAEDDLACDFLAGGITSAFRRWVGEKDRPSAQELSRRVRRLVRSVAPVRRDAPQS
ncbi:TetR/AcrR family transcriptional regulator [Parafannyhessea sp. LCP21S3_E6]|uniref:TetR/AcrR family transcriptional regulator n=1 Tax=unclassified Parafannyhessea TaxID=2847323 RepID=UPI003F977585